MSEVLSTETKFTPGPWFLINDHCVGGPIEPGWEEAGNGVANCGMRARTVEEAKANARLIAAAPELYEAVCRWLTWCDDWYAGKPHPVDDLEFARAALLKARGGSSNEGE